MKKVTKTSEACTFLTNVTQSVKIDRKYIFGKSQTTERRDQEKPFMVYA